MRRESLPKPHSVYEEGIQGDCRKGGGKSHCGLQLGAKKRLFGREGRKGTRLNLDWNASDAAQIWGFNSMGRQLCGTNLCHRSGDWEKWR